MTKKVKPKEVGGLKAELHSLKPAAETPKVLTLVESEQLEKNRALQDIAKRDQTILDLRGELIEARKKILELSIVSLSADRLALKEEKEKALRRLSDAKAASESVMTAIKARLGIEGPFGYNPDTLEVVV